MPMYITRLDAFIFDYLTFFIIHPATFSVSIAPHEFLSVNLGQNIVKKILFWPDFNSNL